MEGIWEEHALIEGRGEPLCDFDLRILSSWSKLGLESQKRILMEVGREGDRYTLECGVTVSGWFCSGVVRVGVGESV